MCNAGFVHLEGEVCECCKKECKSFPDVLHGLGLISFTTSLAYFQNLDQNSR